MQTPQQTARPTAREPGSLIASDKVEGTPVYRPNGDRIGTIERVMIDKFSGKAAYAVMGFGGFLGIGNDHYPIPWALLTYNESLGGYVVAITDDQLNGAPKFSPEETWANDDRHEGLVDGYYGVTPYWEPTDIEQSRILIVATHGFEQSELEVPRDRLRQAGARVDVASLDGKDIRGWNETDWGRTASVHLKIADADADLYDALVIPGGVMNPDKLRVDPDTITLVKSFLDSGKTVAAVCHGPWLLVQADAVRGRKVTSYMSIRKDVENAGGMWEDSEVVTDNGIITSRNPGDLDAFTAKIIEEVCEGRHRGRMAAE